MNRARWIRQTHRWLSVTFTLAVIANIAVNAAAFADARIALYVGLVTLLPLGLLLLTGGYLFVLPYVERRRAPGKV